MQEKACRDIDTHLSNVLWPFEFQIYKRRLNVYVFKKQKMDFIMYSDWNLYEFVLFNVVQNAVKYNKPMDGDIVVILSCKPMK
jgi:K+-sensing histidine kinase KdpD